MDCQDIARVAGLAAMRTLPVSTPVVSAPHFLLALAVLWLAFAAPEGVAGEKSDPAAKAKKAKAEKKSAKKIHPSLVPVEDEPGLPRVLLIGDSISMGYTLPVRERLDGVANVHRIPANGGPTTRGLQNIDKWLGEGDWDLIHFNWGIHDLRHMEDGEAQVGADDYEKNLRALVERLKKTGAALVWATITPIPENPLINDRHFDDENAYNRIATRIMEENGIPINDLHAWMLPRFEEFQVPDDLHYQPDGSEHLADKVAEEIAKRLHPSGEKK